MGTGGGSGVGGSGTGAASGVGGSGTGGAVGTGGGAGNSLLGGYHVHGDWAGFAFTFVDEAKTATISPAHFEDMVDRDGPYCVKGSVAATTTYSSIAAVGFNVSQPKQEDAPVNKIASTGDGVYIDIKVNSGATNVRVQLEDGTDPAAPDSAEHRWCANLTVGPDGTFKDTLPWEAFNTTCWDAATGTPFNPATQLAKVVIYIPDPGAGAAVPFDFCVNDIGPANVTGRGTGEIVANCGTNVTWGATSTNQQFHNIQTSDGRYRFQSNGWGWQGGGSHSISLLPANGFRMDSQTCRRTDDSPCSYPSIYIGTSADGQRSSGSNLPRLLNQITAVPTCMGWSAGTTPATDEYNVSYDVWFNTDANGTEASKFVMVWLRDPPSFQPGGMFPVHDGAIIGGQLWQVWHGPNHQNRPVTSYVAPLARANGQAYSFNLKDFFDDATERGYLNPAQDNLIAVMGGMEIWGGAQSAAITSFRAEVQ